MPILAALGLPTFFFFLVVLEEMRNGFTFVIRNSFARGEKFQLTTLTALNLGCAKGNINLAALTTIITSVQYLSQPSPTVKRSLGLTLSSFTTRLL